MGFGKFLGVVAGGALAIVAAPVVLPAAAAVGAAAATGATVAAGAVATAGTAVASTAVGSAVVGAATTAGTAVASSAVGTAVAGAAATATTAAGAAGAAVAGSTVGTAVAGAAGSAASVVVGSSTATAAIIGSGVTYSGINAAEGMSNMDLAKSIAASAESKYKNKTKKMELSQKKLAKDLEKLNLTKLEVYANVIEKNLDIIKKVQIPEETKLEYLDNPDYALLGSPEEMKDMYEAVNSSKEILEAVGNGASLMQAASSSTLMLVGQIGVASTGTAISSLSGAAAYNATIAALGGGALSAGGGGMALGHAVLGGITVLPAAVFTSWNYAKNAEEAVTNAEEYAADVKKKVADIETNIQLIKRAVTPRVSEIKDTVLLMNRFGTEKVYVDLKAFEERNLEGDKIYFEKCSPEDQDILISSAYYLSVIKRVLATKVFDDSGNLCKETEELLDDVNSEFGGEDE